MTTQQTRDRDLTGFSTKARAWRSFVETSALITNRMEKRLYAVTGLKLAEYNLLLVLTEAENDQLRMGELAERMVFSPSRLSYQVKALAKRGLLTRHIDENDKRGMTAQLTEEGKRVFSTASQVHAQHIKQLFHPALDEAQASELQIICDQIHHSVDQADS